MIRETPSTEAPRLIKQREGSPRSRGKQRELLRSEVPSYTVDTFSSRAGRRASSRPLGRTDTSSSLQVIYDLSST